MKRLTICVYLRHLARSCRDVRLWSLASACLLFLAFAGPAWPGQKYVKSDSPIFPQVQPDRALVYFVVEPSHQLAGTIEVYVDDTPIGFLPKRAYTAVQVKPGVRLVWGPYYRGEWFELKGGRTYLLRYLRYQLQAAAEYSYAWFMDDPGSMRLLVSEKELAHVVTPAAELERLQTKLEKRYERALKEAGSKVGVVLPKIFSLMGSMGEPGTRGGLSAFGAFALGLSRSQLTITEKRLEYRSKKEELVIPVAEIQQVSLGGAGFGSVTPWIRVRYGAVGAPKTASFLGENYNSIFASITSAMEKASATPVAEVSGEPVSRIASVRLLHDAAGRGDLETVKRLIAEGTDVNARDHYGRTPLHDAARNGHIDTARLLIAQGADVNARAGAHGDLRLEPSSGLAPLHEVVWNDHSVLAELLIAHGADLNPKIIGNGLTPLHIAAMDGHKEMAQLLIAKGADVSVTDISGATPLALAVKQGHKDIAKLLQGRADIAVSGDVPARRETRSLHVAAQDPLHAAAEIGDVERMRQLIAKNMDVNVKGTAHEMPLHSAARNGQVAAAKLLIEKGADVNARNGWDDTPLLLAAWRGHIAVAELLIANGADVNAKRLTMDTPLHKAAQLGHKDMVQLLVAKGADVNATQRRGITPLESAISGGHKDIVELLMAKGARSNASRDKEEQTDKKGRTPLHRAAWAGDLDLVTMFVGKGVEINAKDKEDGKTALHVAAAGGFKDVVEFLVSEGADINAMTNDGYTPLHYAAMGDFRNRGGQEEVIEFFLSRGMDINIKTKRGETPLHLAVFLKKRNAVRFLVEHGADVNARAANGEAPIAEAIRMRDQALINLLRQRGAKE